jgi:hypothetical protein
MDRAAAARQAETLANQRTQRTEFPHRQGIPVAGRFNI